ncbi:MAG: hypothetical protein D6785_05430, partial [Planctomycetota bacterium]
SGSTLSSSNVNLYGAMVFGGTETELKAKQESGGTLSSSNMNYLIDPRVILPKVVVKASHHVLYSRRIQ